jgi:hypothetical protein
MAERLERRKKRAGWRRDKDMDNRLTKREELLGALIFFIFENFRLSN